MTRFTPEAVRLVVPLSALRVHVRRVVWHGGGPGQAPSSQALAEAVQTTLRAAVQAAPGRAAPAIVAGSRASLLDRAGAVVGASVLAALPPAGAAGADADTDALRGAAPCGLHRGARP